MTGAPKIASRILELPFRERPVIELLRLESPGVVDTSYAGYGWAKVGRLWLDSHATHDEQVIDDALVLALHAADDGDRLTDDIDLEFELSPGGPAGGESVLVRASLFLEKWLPQLPQDSAAIVLALCNPFGATLRPIATHAPLHYAHGDVNSRLDLRTRIRLSAPRWCTLGSVTDIVRRPVAVIDDDKKQTYAGLYLLKKLDLKPEDGGMEIPVVLPSELSPLDEVLQQLAVDDLISINQKKGRWELTRKGLDYLGHTIDEATDLFDEFEDAEVDEMIDELRRRNLDPFRARFLWGWWEGELDDLVVFQERRGVSPIERMWAFYLMSDEFYTELAKDLG